VTSDEKFEAGVWTTRDGREVALVDMDQSHLENLLVWFDKRMRELDEERLQQQHFIIESGFDEDRDYLLAERAMEACSEARARVARWIPLVNAELERRRELTVAEDVVVFRLLEPSADCPCGNRYYESIGNCPACGRPTWSEK
jgi:hypothetical protein